MRVVTLFAPQLWDAVETMAYFLASDGVYYVRLATSLDGDEKSEHPWVLNRVRQFGRIEVVRYDDVPYESDILIFYLVRNGRISEGLPRWRKRARSVVYLSPTEGPLSFRDWLRETVRSFPHYLGAQKICYFPHIHPKFLVNPSWLHNLFGPIDVDVQRRWRLGFLGNREPPERSARLAQCKKSLVGWEAHVNWLEYGGWETGKTRGMDPMDYMRTLLQIDFCISPPGWGLQWTHRTVEALVTGSIPIIEDPQIYNLDLIDGENCIVAEPTNWATAMQRALDTSDDEIRRMRKNVIALRDALLAPERARSRFRSQLIGIQP